MGSQPHRTPNITIVGGRPPGERGPHGGREGIDAVLLRAALDKRFGARFVSQPEVALARCGIELSEIERGVLLSSTPEQREAMVEGVARNLVDRRGWFARLAGVLGVFVGGTVLAASGCCVNRVGTLGSTSEEPEGMGGSYTDGIRPDSPERTRGVRADDPPRTEFTAGKRADLPPRTDQRKGESSSGSGTMGKSR